MYLFLLLAYPILGAGIKYIDAAFDEKTFNKKIAYFVAPLLGILWAYTMMISPISATILLAVLIGVVVKGKIDNYAHLAGLVVILPIIFLTGIELMILPLIFLASAALLDEVGNDIIDNNKKYLNNNKIWQKFVVYFFDHRWLMKIAILGIAIIGIIPFYFFLAMLMFDYSYLMVRWYANARKDIPSIGFHPTIFKFKNSISQPVTDLKAISKE